MSLQTSGKNWEHPELQNIMTRMRLRDVSLLPDERLHVAQPALVLPLLLVFQEIQQIVGKILIDASGI
jgi:hypothetical protein